MVGSTASGKSTVAIEVARRRRDVDLVSIDSMQVYRGMDIGTAKPSPAERAEVRHHLLDLVDPWEDFSVAEFQRHYHAVLVELVAVARHAVLVGGTGLYHRAVIDELTLPGEWPEIRARLFAEADEVGAPVLHERLRALDPEAAAKMEPSNTRRVERALEVCLGSGRPFSSFGPGIDAHPPTPVAQIGLRWPREVLAARIERRVHEMVAAGLVDEVAALHRRGLSRTAAQALGYKEVIEHLEGRCTLEEAIESTIVRTRQFAVRQLRWFGRDPRVRWVDLADPVEGGPAATLEPAIHLVLEALDA